MRRKNSTSALVQCQFDSESAPATNVIRNFSISLPDKNWIIVDLLTEHEIMPSFESHLNSAINDYLTQISIKLANVKALPGNDRVTKRRKNSDPD